MYITNGETYLRFDNIDELKKFFPIEQPGMRKTKDRQNFISVRTNGKYNGIDLNRCSFPIYFVYTRIKAGYDIEYKPISVREINKTKAFYTDAVEEFDNLLL